ncbi:MAG: hypothetical protein A3G45_01595 [Candidatus Staskawiczbacteria bacterium RIFCSPLOWO2_12_FULL_37_15]|uniref:Uncharacterized protein n=1 Tax=Candidatus Staskawiczbacteria bacterium RIFCSPLOWO2_12_FULL_37_15 TaxID=1802218 RepID=A0A1G2IK57_9BACT|nr:MAG: hypothetical protein A3G45_01595 [Candidatus Staskawiczbacteria bacterium RIFCSPLOWO2_12_FULL_37_15]
MVDANKKEEVGKQEISPPEQGAGLPGEKREAVAEKTEMSGPEIEMIKEELRREIELMDQNPELKKEAEDKAKKIGALAADKMLEHLLEIAQQRGLTFALAVAKKMNDPYILDTFHDLLAKEGYYKKFTR